MKIGEIYRTADEESDAIEITQFRDFAIAITSSTNRWCIP